MKQEFVIKSISNPGAFMRDLYITPPEALMFESATAAENFLWERDCLTVMDCQVVEASNVEEI